MAGKALSESAWKAFAKGKGYEDDGLVKALAGIAKAGEDPAALAKALKALEPALVPLRKAAKSDKALAAQLGAIDKAAAEAGRAVSHVANQSDANEDEGPTALTIALPALVRQIRAGQTMQALVTTIGKESAVLLSRKTISTAQRKVLVEYLASRDVKGTPKHAGGTCALEDNCLVFALDSEAAGLARKINAALLVQFGQRLKVRVRGTDGEDVDVADVEGAVAGGDAPEGAAQVALGQALDAIAERVNEALKALHPQATKLRAALAFAQEKAAAADLSAAASALSTLRRLLDAPAGQPPTSGSGLAEALANWRSTRDGVVAMLKQLAREAAASGDPDARAAVIEVTAVVKQLTAEPATAEQVNELMRWVESDDVVGDVDELAQGIREPLMQSLRGVRQALAA